MYSCSCTSDIFFLIISISCKTALVWMNSLSFCLPAWVFVSHSHLKDSFQGKSRHGWQLFPAILWMSHPIPSWPISFCSGKYVYMIIISHVIHISSLVALSTSCFSLRNLIIEHLRVDLLALNWTSGLWTSCTCTTMSFSRDENFSAIIFLIYFLSLPQSQVPLVLITQTFVLIMLSQSSHKLSSFLLIIFLLLLPLLQLCVLKQPVFMLTNSFLDISCYYCLLLHF